MYLAVDWQLDREEQSELLCSATPIATSHELRCSDFVTHRAPENYLCMQST